MALPTRRRETTPTRQGRRPGAFRELEELQDWMSQLMENAWLAGPPDDAPRPWVPSVDVEETEDAWIVEAELPGVSRDDVNVELRDSELVISGEVKERERKGILRRRTRRTGMFEFRVTLPDMTGSVGDDAIDAQLKDGILTVRIAKPEQSRPRRIAVKG
jgi:HSP20 family protein